jgi:dTDP-4-dehydrorhamnose reductase
MRALVIGASGQIGSALCEVLVARGHEVVGTHARVPQPATRPLDLGDPEATARLIGAVAPRWVFCPAALSFVDYCEDHPEETFRMNRDAAAHAAGVAARQGAGFVFYSSEYVFDGRDGPYAEDDPVHPLSVYGQSKLAGEEATLAANPGTLVIRTAGVYGPEPQGKNFVCQVLRRAAAGERMRVAVDQVSTPTYNADVATASVELAEGGATGIAHVAGSGLLDRHRFGTLVCEAFGLDRDCLEPATTAALGQRAPRPLRAGLVTKRLAGLTCVPRAPADGLRALRAALDARERRPVDA